MLLLLVSLAWVIAVCFGLAISRVAGLSGERDPPDLAEELAEIHAYRAHLEAAPGHIQPKARGGSRWANG
jgi:hypothetical protein